MNFFKHKYFYIIIIFIIAMTSMGYLVFFKKNNFNNLNKSQIIINNKNSENHKDIEEKSHSESELPQLLITKFTQNNLHLYSVIPTNLVEKLQFNGEISVNQEQLAHVTLAFSARVIDVLVHKGELVKKGQILALFSSAQSVQSQADIQVAKTDIRLAQAAVKTAEQTYQREKKLFDEKISAKQDFLAAEAELNEMKIRLQAAEQKLNVAEQQLKHIGAKTDAKGHFAVYAPIAGEITEKHLVLGEQVAAGTNIFMIANIETVWAEFKIPVDQRQLIRVGQMVNIQSQTGQNTDASIAHLASISEENTRMIEGHIVLKNQPQSWHPGQFIQVMVSPDNHPDKIGLLIPSEAIQIIEEKPTVFIKKSAHYLPVLVNLGEVKGNKTVINSGLQTGDQIVTQGSFLLKAELAKSKASHVH